MSDKEFNKPKNISQLGESFEERLARLGREAKGSSNPSPSYPVSSQQKPTSKMPANRSAKQSRQLDQNVKATLDKYKAQGKAPEIFRLWQMLLMAFDSKLKFHFGDEPDEELMSFAVTLTPDGFERLEANLLERLDSDKEWPPSIVRLAQLANSPTKEAMYISRQKLFHHPVPMSALNRVEKFIKQFKMREVRNFSERNFEAEFNRKYTLWFRQVMLENADIKIEEEQRKIDQFISLESQTSHDKQREDDIASGKAFEHKFGARILETINSKPEQEELTLAEIERIEQERLAKKIIDSSRD